MPAARKLHSRIQQAPPPAKVLRAALGSSAGWSAVTPAAEEIARSGYDDPTPLGQTLSQIAKALRMSAEVLYVRAGILEPGEASKVHHAIVADTAISERQKQVLLDIYTSFCQQNEAAREGSPTE